MSDGNSLNSLNNTGSNKFTGFDLFWLKFKIYFGAMKTQGFAYNDESSLKKENMDKIETE